MCVRNKSQRYAQHLIAEKSKSFSSLAFLVLNQLKIYIQQNLISIKNIFLILCVYENRKQKEKKYRRNEQKKFNLVFVWVLFEIKIRRKT